MSEPWRPKCGQFDEPTGAGLGFVHCRLNLYGGRPSLGRCNRCQHNPAKGTMPAPTAPVQVRVPTAEERAAAERAQTEVFHRLWDTLHRGALAGTLINDVLEDVAKQLPCGQCRIHFAAIRAATDVLDFAATVGWHNTVNVEQGKPLMTVAEARELFMA